MQWLCSVKSMEQIHVWNVTTCKRALSKNHPDIITITHEKPNSIGIEDIRIQLIDDVSIKPYTGPYKNLYSERSGKN